MREYVGHLPFTSFNKQLIWYSSTGEYRCIPISFPTAECVLCCSGAVLCLIGYRLLSRRSTSHALPGRQLPQLLPSGFVADLRKK